MTYAKFLGFVLILSTFILILSTSAFASGIYNNSGSVSADSFCVSFYSLDANGNLETLDTTSSTTDSMSIVIWAPFMNHGDAPAYSASVKMLDARIGEKQVLTGGGSSYIFSDAVATLAPSAVNGVYSYMVVAKKNGQTRTTVVTGHLQIYTTRDFNLALDYTKNALDSLQAQDDWGLHSTISTNLNTTVSSRSTFDYTTNKVTLVDTSAAALNWLGLMWGVGNNSSTAAKQIAYPIGAYNKDSIFIYQSPYAASDTIGKIFYYRTIPNGPVDSIKIRKTTPGP